MYFQVQLSQPTTVPVTVAYATVRRRAATAGSDYTAVQGFVTFNPGETFKSVGVPWTPT